MNTLQGKKIVLGITGSIAAYKAAVLTRGLIKKGAEVQIVITPAGKEFITPITLSALTSKPVISEFFSQRDGTWHSHVDLGLWADEQMDAWRWIVADHRKDGARGSRQHAGDDLPVDEGSGVCGSGHGPGYVCSSFYPA